MPRRKKTETNAVDGEHIFPATHLTKLALRWRELHAKGKHSEAMLLLEEIIIGSTQMFERQAQHEGYQYTVPLERLVSAAQEKVVKWLLKWNPKKGRLFSWFCLYEDTAIRLEDGSVATIGELVRRKYSGNVLCWNVKTEKFESKKVVGWSRQRAERGEWRKLTITENNQDSHIYITKDHRVWTNSGYAPVDKLNKFDILSARPNRRMRKVRHKHNSKSGRLTWSVESVFNPTAKQSKKLKWKYDLEVEDNHNFLVGEYSLLVHNSKCAKNSFRSEVIKESQYRNRYHVTSDNLEKFYGAEDPDFDKDDAEKNVQKLFEEIYVRWGDPQERGAIKYLLECILDEENHDKAASIRSAAFAHGIGPDLSKFFYNWCLMELRHQYYEQIHIPFTEQDLFRHAHSYSHLTDMLNIVTWDQMKKMIAIMGGSRIKIPTLTQMVKLSENYRLWKEIDKGDKDPDAVEGVAQIHKRTGRSAQEVYHEMSEIVDGRRSGEYGLND